MCGIFGIIASNKAKSNVKKLNNAIDNFFILSESRGKESAGIAVKNLGKNAINVFKMPMPAHAMSRTREYKNFFTSSTIAKNGSKNTIDAPLTIIGHSRLVTNGSENDNFNNQPVIKNGCIAVHNGIIVNADELWKKYSHVLTREYVVDTEIFLAILRLYINQTNSLIKAVQNTFGEIKGAASVAVVFDDLDKLLLATNTGSLYYSINKAGGWLYFASEKYILTKFLRKTGLSKNNCRQIKPFTSVIIDINSITTENLELTLADTKNEKIQFKKQKDNIKDLSPLSKSTVFNVNQNQANKKLLENNYEPISKLRRCVKCLLPETFPFIKYDESGLCIYCQNYHKLSYQGLNKLKMVIQKYKKEKGKHDCIVTLSGGRDSSYTMHYIKKELGLNPIAFTYDWGMVTDLARRNQARICGQLGVEHILLSADIRKKRKNIKKNIIAWLKKPNLGIIPLFMAGDKQVHYYIYKIKEQTKINLNIWSVNRLEKTDFKAGFCGIRPEFGQKPIDYLPMSKSFKLSFYYLNQYLTNPAFINSSLGDTLWAYVSQYFIPRKDFHNLFDFIRWDEKIIETTLLNEYDWETSPDTKTTWRIGDGTASFYNYIYYTVAGFTENDTFRSNQIREGVLSRKDAMEIITKENRPRYESIKWYCDTVGIDFLKTINIINKINKLYARN